MQNALLSLDVGTTAVKAALFDPDGDELLTAERPLTLRTPQPGHAVLDPEELWNVILAVLQEIAKNSPAAISGLAVATQGGSFLAVDAAGQPTTPILTWMDRRSQPVVTAWKKDGLEPFIRRACGWSLDPGLPLAMISWLHSNDPETFHRSAFFLSVNDFINQRLCGVYAMNPSMAGEMMLTDISTGTWSPDLCSLAGIQPAQLSPIHPSGSILGTLLPEVSRQTGLSEKVRVVNGGQDHACEALAAGMTTPGTALLACGTAWVINGARTSGDMSAVPEGMNLNFHVLNGRWMVSRFLGPLGGTLEWWINRLWQSPDTENPVARSRLYRLLDDSLRETHPGSNGLFFLPLGGSNTAPVNPGRGGFWGLQLDHTRADMTRAIMESAVCELRFSLEKLKETGLPTEKIWMIGGAAHSPLWPSIVASLTSAAVTLTHYSHGPALGAAILTGLALGIYPDVDAGRACFDLKPRLIEPNPAWMPLYDEYFQQYCRLASRLSTLD